MVLIALNAKFIHSSLALRSLKAYCNSSKDDIEIMEFTINNDLDYIIEEIYKKNPKAAAFSCYIWNISMIIEITRILKKIMPNLIGIFGGAEVSYQYDYLFKKGVDIISIGEGEKSTKALYEYICNGKGRLEEIKGIAFKKGNEIIKTGPCDIVQLDDIPFVYYDCINEMENKIIYYEASRGCPYNCQYCLSSAKTGLRFLSLERVFKDLQFFIDKNVPQVKFVDRTFNCRKNYAMSIWKYLIENDIGKTNFHFEISADTLDDEMITLLRKARKGLFQFEIGVQSTNIKTLEDVNRKTDNKKLFDNVLKIKKANNICQHLDLIAGLPEETYKSFRKSFNDVYELYPQQLQLGFLKVLKGCGLRDDAEKYGIVYKQKAPYEVLYTNDISYIELRKLKMIEDLVEKYYNSNKAIYTLRYAVNFFETSFDFYEKFAEYWKYNKYHTVSHNKMKLYTILFDFLNKKTDSNILKNILKFDMLLNDNVKSFPNWVDDNNNDNKLRDKKRHFFNDEFMTNKYIPSLKLYTAAQKSRICRLEKFDIDIQKWIESDFKELLICDKFILFNYSNGIEYSNITEV